MVAKTAWHSLVATLGPLPSACKALSNDELTHLLEHSRRSRLLHEQEIDQELESWLAQMPSLLRRAVRQAMRA